MEDLGKPYQFFDNAVKGSGDKAREAFDTGHCSFITPFVPRYARLHTKLSSFVFKVELGGSKQTPQAYIKNTSRMVAPLPTKLYEEYEATV
jgi:hypothetical protein